LTMMGIYTVDPASLAYELVSPAFTRVVIQLRAPYSGKTFTIEAEPRPEDNPYVQNVKLNGRDHGQNWIQFGDISVGGELLFALGPDPNKSWGSAAQDAPPSLSEVHP